MKTVSVIGLGYIGLPTAAVMASRGITVIGVDVDPLVVDIINRGKVHIVEPDLDMLVRAAVTAGHLRATPSPEPADAFIITVPTPFCDGHKPNLSYVKAAADLIAPVLKKGDLVILESTSPVGTTEQMADWLALARPDLSFPRQACDSADIQIAYCPERVLPGTTLHELVYNHRIVGGMTGKASEKAVALYKTFVKGDCIVADVRTAEMCKLAENAYRDINIAYANELSMICDKLDIDVWQLISLANRHPRVDILKPGPGVGGHCVAVDPWFIVDKTPDEARLIRTAREVNDEKARWAVLKIEQAIEKLETQANPTSPVNIACLGLTYKADIDDLRESPALAIVQALAQKHAGRVAVVEPNIEDLPRGLTQLDVTKKPLEEAIDWATIVVTLVGHKQFKAIRLDQRSTPCIVDLVGIGKG
jgi:UDP-N-acetyl-D-mannosaminuronic acid dehydrogenase